MNRERPCCGVSTNIEDYFLTRRRFLNRVGMGLGALGLATMLNPADLVCGPEAAKGISPTDNPLAPRPPPLLATARAVIHIFAQGAPSHIDTWDPKPELVRMDGRSIGDSGVAMGSPFKFNPMGRSGTEVSELFPGIGQHVDDIAVVRSMYTDIPAHEVATVFMNTGSLRIAKPSMGSWVVYGLGTGFVPTPDDLGNQSAPPSNPELLDYLSSRFVEGGWSIKKLQRLVMLSSAYQEASTGNPRYADSDPDNKLQWRFNVRQLDFEQMHDSILAIAGTIDFTMGGRPVPIGSEGFATRRAVYAFIDRRNPAEILTQFNFPNPSVPTGKRFLTQVPQQQLFLMNSPLVIETARKLVHSPEFTAQTTDELRVAALYIALFQRPPTPQETALCLRYVESNPGGTSTDLPETAQSERASQFAERQARMAQAAQKNLRRKNAFQVEPGAAAFKSRAPLDAWTKLAHGLFQTNEAMFLN